jgi:DNA-binding winged helix-turn-helix (wHTH) protein/TolB-like protein/Tfp pilus assembly protein PilF
MNGSDNHRVAFAEFELDRAHRRLYRDGETVPLYSKAFDLLVFLIEHNGDVVQKSEILDMVWADQFVEEANLSVQISALRKALGETTYEPRFLITVPGVGYKFVADVKKADAVDDEIVIEKHRIERYTVTADTDGVEGLAIKELPAGRARRRSWILGLSAVALIAALGAAGYFYYSAQKPRIASVAVLPFEYQDRDPNSEYLSEGLAESVIHSLSSSPDLRVMSRNSAFRFRGPEPDVRAIGRELNVDAILTGRIVTLGENLSIRAELISATDNSVVWGEQFTRKFEDVERLQADIADSIAQRLRLRLADDGSTHSERGKNVDPEAYRLTLLGRYYLNKLTDEGFRKGLDQFQKAIERDPNYAPAHAGLAQAYNRLSGFNAIPPYEGFPKARAEAEKALELDDRLADAHATLGSVKLSYDWDWAGSEKEFNRAIEISPNDADARQQYSYHLASLGRFDEALVQMKHALELDPLSLEKYAGVGEILYLRRDYDGAIQQYNKSLEMESNSGFLHWAIGNVYVRKGMYEEAIAEYRKSIPLSGDSPDEPASLAYALAVSGRREEAQAILKQLEENYPKRYVSPSTLAIICAGLGDDDRAFDWLEKAYERRDLLLILLKVEPMFDPLRDDPRFTDLARRVGHAL